METIFDYDPTEDELIALFGEPLTREEYLRMYGHLSEGVGLTALYALAKMRKDERLMKKFRDRLIERMGKQAFELSIDYSDVATEQAHLPTSQIHHHHRPMSRCKPKRY